MKLPFTISAKDSQPISVAMQKVVIGAVALTTIAGLVFTASIYVFNSNTFSWPYAWNVIGLQLMPIVVFGLAYSFSGNSPTVLSRTFVAVLKAIVVVSIFSSLQLAKNSLGIFASQSSEGATPSAWITSFYSDFVIFAVCLAVYGYVEYVQKWKKV